MTTTETYDDPSLFAAAVRKAQRAATKQRKPAVRPILPRAEVCAPTGLTPLLVAGWSSSFVVGKGFRMTRGALDTGWCASERDMCQAAKRMAQ